MKLYNENVIDSIVDIYRTSPINPNYPHGMNCEICRKAGIECYTDSGDGYECNTGYVKYLEQKLAERKQSTVSAISLDKVKQARKEIKNIDLNDYGDNLYQFQAKCSEILSKLIESEENIANEQISKIKKKYLIMDEYGYTDEKLVNKVNELVDKVNELNTQIQHKTEIIPHKATNGEKIEAMFPSTKIRWISQSHIGVTFRDNQDYITEFELDWWNAPFDEGVEE